MKRILKQTLTSKFLLVLVPLIILSEVLIFSYQGWQFYKKAANQQINDLNEMLEVQSVVFAHPLWEYDIKEINVLIDHLSRLPEVESIALFDTDNKKLASHGDLASIPQKDEFRKKQDIYYKSKEETLLIGSLQITVNNKVPIAAIKSQLWLSARILATLLLVLIATLAFTIKSMISSPLDMLLTSIEKSKSKGEVSEVAWESSDELGTVVEAYNGMLRAQQNAEENLLTTNHKLEGILNNLDDTYIEADRIGHITYINPAFYKMFGYNSSDKIIGMPAINLYARKEEREKLHNELKVRGKILDKTLLAIRKDSKTFWVSLNIRLDYNENGTLIGTKAVIRNISDRIEAEQKLSKTKERLEGILNNLDDAYIEADQSGKVTYINAVFVKMFRYESIEEIQGMPAINLYAKKEDREKLHQELNEKGKVLDKTLLAIRKDSSTFWVSLNIRLDFDENGEFRGVKGLIRDISQRKKMEDKLVDVNEKLNGILDNVDDAFFQIGLSGNITYVNSAASKMYGYSSIKELIGRPILDLYANKSDHNRALEEINKDGKIHDFHALGLKKDSTKFWASLNGKRMYNENGNITGYQAVARDINHSKEMQNQLKLAKEKAEESDQLKTAFLLNISHEIRTPMNGILGFMEFLQEPDLSETERSEFIKIINKSGDRLMDTLNDIVEISKIEIGDIEIHEEKVDLAEIMQFHFDFFYPQLKEKGIDLAFTNQVAEPIKSDKHKLNGILMNLLKNAIKFTEKGKIEFGCQINKGFVSFYVSDTGNGIPADKQEMIFDRFVQADYTLNRGYEGSGIGLSIVKSYVDALKGTIEVKSEVGKGSTFVVAVPFVPFKKPVEDNSMETLIKTSESKPTVLVAEDDEVNYLFIKRILSKEFKVIHAQNGEEAVQIFNKTQDISIVLMDIKMPGKFDGLEAIRKIKQFKKPVPIIAQSAFAMDTDKKNAFDAGCDDYIAKPFKEDELLQCVQKVI